jgi:DNA sulfur modification protein DndD
VISLASFSAGERQLFALATLRALREASGRHLPFVVDSPTARLDVVHRRRFLGDYIPATGFQAILFGTDHELDEMSLEYAEPFIARIYRLSLDMDEGYTRVSQEEPWRVQSVALSA